MRPRSPDPDDGDARARTLPAGWAEGTLDDGRTYYFNLAKPGAVSFTFPEAAEAQQQSAQAQCVALHAWDQQAGAAADDLMFTSGARIAIVSEEPGQGWLTGRVVDDESGQTGIFPANFVERTAAEAARLAALHACHARCWRSCRRLLSSSSIVPRARCRCAAPHRQMAPCSCCCSAAWCAARAAACSSAWGRRAREVVWQRKCAQVC